MKNTNQPPDSSYKKEPLPDQEQTVSSASSLPLEDYYARYGTERGRKEEVRRLRERLVDPRYHLRMPGVILTAPWRKLLGKGTCYQLLAVLMRTCDWKARRWHGNTFALAAVMGLSDRQVRTQLNKLMKIKGFKKYRHPRSITIILSDRVFPQDAEKKDV